MDHPISLKQVAEVLNVHRSRVEQAISRGQFLPRLFSEPGKPREWTVSEVMRLAVFFDLVDNIGMDPKDAGRLTQGGLYGFKDGAAIFVAWQGEHASATYPEGSNEPLRAEVPGAWYGEILRAHDAGEFVTNSWVHRSVLVNLDRIEAQLQAEWPGRTA
ncbi:hypothetical protein Amn_23570 [Aminobacter sp. Y103A]|uniref:hypothetical protein n=1 Tax=Aminobacter sp. Y103A TaxID=1870862 RepID=UPI002573BDB3|nr:hypothetical protein [Aminobacter sp. SS-2016]BBD37477.1 hypothetical protein Amn_23570 [Aminobacter sp. SS-2016]